MKTSTKQARRFFPAREKDQILAAYAARGVSQAEFCRERALGLTTLQYWLRRRKEGTERKPGFIELKVPMMPPSGEWAVAIDLPGGTRLKAAPGIDPRWLGLVAEALRCGA